MPFNRNLLRSALIVLFSLAIVYSTHARKYHIRGKQYHLTGKINGDINLPPDCGIFANGIVIEFEIIKLTGMKYYHSSIGIIITCPEFLGNSFIEKGKT